MPEPEHISDDVLIRRAGFRIHSRPKGKPAVWIRNGATCPHPLALDVAKRLEAEKKLAAEIMDRGGESQEEVA